MLTSAPAHPTRPTPSLSSLTLRFLVVGGLAAAALALTLLSSSTPAATAEPGVTTDSNWAPFVGELRMWCTKANGIGSCASHHDGWAIDVDMPLNEPIYSTGAGEIVQVYGGCDPLIGYCNGGAGNWVSVDHDTHWARYIHLASFAPGIEVGAWVEAGQLIGYAGGSGTSSGGVHLHYDETLPQSLPVTRVFFGPFLACHGDTAVQYPDVLGTTDWQQVPHGTMLRNDGYECLGGITPDPPLPPEPTPTPEPLPPREPDAPGGADGLAIGDFLGNGRGGLAIGSPGEDIGSIVDAGLVIVAHNDGSGISSHDEAVFQGGRGLRGANEKDDLAGAAVAAGDFDCDGYDDLAVGHPGEDVGAVANAGSVSVTYGSPSTIRNRSISLYQNDVTLPGPVESGDMTGAALAVGDFDGDGCDDLAIGIPGEDIDDRVDAGAAVVILGGPGGFGPGSRTSPLLFQGGELAGFTEAGDLLGSSLAAGDFNCDGADDLAIGAPHESVDTAVRAGAVSIIYSNGSGIGGSGSTTTTIFQSDGLAGVLESGDQVGTALAAGDFDNDGCDDLAAGAALEDLDGGVDAGAVSVAYGSPSGLAASTVHYQGGGGVPGKIEPGDNTGSAVVAVDLDCDGYDDLAVGVAGEGIGSRDDAGYVAVLRGTPAGISGTVGRFFQASGGLAGANESGDALGTALAAGDLNGDGCDDLAIAGPGEDLGSRADAGVVWIVLGGQSGPTPWGVLYQGRNLPGAAEAGDVLGGPSVTELLGIPS